MRASPENAMAAGLLAVSTMLAFPAAADQSDIALRICAGMDDDLDRLACYDRVSGRTPKTTVRTRDNWTVSEDVSKLTDEKNVTMYVQSDETVDCGWNRNDHIRLIVRCLENRTSLFFATNCHMTSSDYNNYGDITYRLDDDKARTVKGNESTDNKALGLWSGGRSIPVIRQMFGKDRMIVRMTPYNESPFTATFNISGLENQIESLRTACHW